MLFRSREMLAENLVLFECEEAEEILYNMLSDKNRMVRLEALDSICIGRSQKAIEKVATMMSGQWYLIRMYAVMTLFDLLTNASGVNETSVYKGYKQDKIEMRGDRAEMSDFPLYLNTVAGGLDRRDQTIGGFSFVVKIYAVPVVEIIG